MEPLANNPKEKPFWDRIPSWGKVGALVGVYLFVTMPIIASYVREQDDKKKEK